MRYLDVERLIDAPIEVVWDVLVTVEQWPRWGPIVGSVELDSPRIRAGSRGSIRTSVGPRVAFEVTEFIDGERWAWRVAGFSATDHRVERVDGQTRVTFGVPWFAPAYRRVCAIALGQIDRIAREQMV